MINHHSRFETWLPAFFDGEFEWDFLNPAFVDTKIMPMDFDAVVERRGHILIFETKIPGKGMPKGQAITLTTMWRDKGATVMCLEGKTAPDITGFSIYSGWDPIKSGAIGDKPMTPGNALDVLYAVRRWFQRASADYQPTRAEWNRQLWVLDYDGHDWWNVLQSMIQKDPST